MIACDGCGQLFGERDYQVVVGRVPGRFHSLDCAEKAWRRHVAEERLFAPPALLALALLAACDTRVSTEPVYQPQIVNVKNDFAFQVTGLDVFTSDVVYSW